ncbi:hypothetical protein, partial [Kocuria rhizophila]
RTSLSTLPGVDHEEYDIVGTRAGATPLSVPGALVHWPHSHRAPVVPGARMNPRRAQASNL